MKEIQNIKGIRGVEYLVKYLSPLVPSKREKNKQTEATLFVPFCIFFEHRAIYVYFYKTKLSQFVYFSLVLREREETKTKYSVPKCRN